MIICNSTADTRFFIYEVSGLYQKQQAKNDSYTISDSGNTFIQVPYNRMNEQMQSITRMGGTIVNIRPLNQHLPEGE